MYAIFISRFYQRFKILQGRYIRIRAAEAFNSGGKIMGQEILEKECTSGQHPICGSAGCSLSLVEKSTALKVRKLFRTPQKFK